MEGFIYCFSNGSMPGLLKIGATERPPFELLKEANDADAWRPPAPYNLEFAKAVREAKAKENSIHRLLARFAERRGFFRAELEDVRALFNLLDGPYWTPPPDAAEDNEDGKSENGKSVDGKKPCRDPSKVFYHGQKIRHRTKVTNHTWVATWDATAKAVDHEGKKTTLNVFASNHYRIERPDRGSVVNAWNECECETASGWVSIKDLPVIAE